MTLRLFASKVVADTVITGDERCRPLFLRDDRDAKRNAPMRIELHFLHDFSDGRAMQVTKGE